MTRAQQAQAYNYFQRVANEWPQKTEGKFAQDVGVIAQRNACVLRALDRFVRSGRFLDITFLEIGRGTGELTVGMAAKGSEAWGLDYAQNMIESASAEPWYRNRHFVCASFFEFPPVDAGYDILGALAFIEHYSPEQWREFIAKTFSITSSRWCLGCRLPLPAL